MVDSNIVIVPSSSEEDNSDHEDKDVMDKTIINEVQKIFSNIFLDKHWVKKGVFPLMSLKELSGEISKCMSTNYSPSTGWYFWRTLFKLIESIDIPEIDLSKNVKYNIIICDIMSEYINCRCKIFKAEIDKNNLTSIEIANECESIERKLLFVFKNDFEYVTLTLLKVNQSKYYASILYPLFKSVLSKQVHLESDGLVAYTRLMLCFRRWKEIVSLASDKELINSIARNVLPPKLPQSTKLTKIFGQILPFVMRRKREEATKFLLMNKLLDVNKAIEKFFQVYDDYLNKLYYKSSDYQPVNGCNKNDEQQTLNNEGNEINNSEIEKQLYLNNLFISLTSDSSDDDSENIETKNLDISKINNNNILGKKQKKTSKDSILGSPKNHNILSTNNLPLEKHNNEKTEIIIVNDSDTSDTTNDSSSLKKPSVLVNNDADDENVSDNQKNPQHNQKYRRKKRKRRLYSFLNKLDNSASETASDTFDSDSNSVLVFDAIQLQSRVVDVIRSSRNIKKTIKSKVYFGEVSSTTNIDLHDSDTNTQTTSSRGCQVSLDCVSSNPVNTRERTQSPDADITTSRLIDSDVVSPNILETGITDDTDTSDKFSNNSVRGNSPTPSPSILRNNDCHSTPTCSKYITSHDNNRTVSIEVASNPSDDQSVPLIAQNNKKSLNKLELISNPCRTISISTDNLCSTSKSTRSHLNSIHNININNIDKSNKETLEDLNSLVPNNTPESLKTICEHFLSQIKILHKKSLSNEKDLNIVPLLEIKKNQTDNSINTKSVSTETVSIHENIFSMKNTITDSCFILDNRTNQSVSKEVKLNSIHIEQQPVLIDKSKIIQENTNTVNNSKNYTNLFNILSTNEKYLEDVCEESTNKTRAIDIVDICVNDSTDSIQEPSHLLKSTKQNVEIQEKNSLNNNHIKDLDLQQKLIEKNSENKSQNYKYTIKIRDDLIIDYKSKNVNSEVKNFKEDQIIEVMSSDDEIEEKNLNKNSSPSEQIESDHDNLLAEIDAVVLSENESLDSLENTDDELLISEYLRKKNQQQDDIKFKDNAIVDAHQENTTVNKEVFDIGVQTTNFSVNAESDTLCPTTNNTSEVNLDGLEVNKEGTNSTSYYQKQETEFADKIQSNYSEKLTEIIEKPESSITKQKRENKSIEKVEYVEAERISEDEPNISKQKITDCLEKADDLQKVSEMHKGKPMTGFSENEEIIEESNISEQENINSQDDIIKIVEHSQAEVMPDESKTKNIDSQEEEIVKPQQREIIPENLGLQEEDESQEIEQRADIFPEESKKKNLDSQIENEVLDIVEHPQTEQLKENNLNLQEKDQILEIVTPVQTDIIPEDSIHTDLLDKDEILDIVEHQQTGKIQEQSKEKNIDSQTCDEILDIVEHQQTHVIPEDSMEKNLDPQEESKVLGIVNHAEIIPEDTNEKNKDSPDVLDIVEHQSKIILEQSEEKHMGSQEKVEFLDIVEHPPTAITPEDSRDRNMETQEEVEVPEIVKQTYAEIITEDPMEKNIDSQEVMDIVEHQQTTIIPAQSGVEDLDSQEEVEFLDIVEYPLTAKIPEDSTDKNIYPQEEVEVLEIVKHKYAEVIPENPKEKNIDSLEEDQVLNILKDHQTEIIPEQSDEKHIDSPGEDEILDIVEHHQQTEQSKDKNIHPQKQLEILDIVKLKHAEIIPEDPKEINIDLQEEVQEIVKYKQAEIIPEDSMEKNLDPQEEADVLKIVKHKHAEIIPEDSNEKNIASQKVLDTVEHQSEIIPEQSEEKHMDSQEEDEILDIVEQLPTALIPEDSMKKNIDPQEKVEVLDIVKYKHKETLKMQEKNNEFLEIIKHNQKEIIPEESKEIKEIVELKYEETILTGTKDRIIDSQGKQEVILENSTYLQLQEFPNELIAVDLQYKLQEDQSKNIEQEDHLKIIEQKRSNKEHEEQKKMEFPMMVQENVSNIIEDKTTDLLEKEVQNISTPEFCQADTIPEGQSKISKQKLTDSQADLQKDTILNTTSVIFEQKVTDKDSIIEEDILNEKTGDSIDDNSGEYDITEQMENELLQEEESKHYDVEKILDKNIPATEDEVLKPESQEVCRKFDFFRENSVQANPKNFASITEPSSSVIKTNVQFLVTKELIPDFEIEENLSLESEDQSSILEENIERRTEDSQEEIYDPECHIGINIEPEIILLIENETIQEQPVECAEEEVVAEEYCPVQNNKEVLTNEIVEEEIITDSFLFSQYKINEITNQETPKVETDTVVEINLSQLEKRKVYDEEDLPLSERSAKLRRQLKSKDKVRIKPVSKCKTKELDIQYSSKNCKVVTQLETTLELKKNLPSPKKTMDFPSYGVIDDFMKGFGLRRSNSVTSSSSYIATKLLTENKFGDLSIFPISNKNEDKKSLTHNKGRRTKPKTVRKLEDKPTPFLIKDILGKIDNNEEKRPLPFDLNEDVTITPVINIPLHLGQCSPSKETHNLELLATTAVYEAVNVHSTSIITIPLTTDPGKKKKGRKGSKLFALNLDTKLPSIKSEIKSSTLKAEIKHIRLPEPKKISRRSTRSSCSEKDKIEIEENVRKAMGFSPIIKPKCQKKMQNLINFNKYENIWQQEKTRDILRGIGDQPLPLLPPIPLSILPPPIPLSILSPPIPLPILPPPIPLPILSPPAIVELPETKKSNRHVRFSKIEFFDSNLPSLNLSDITVEKCTAKKFLKNDKSEQRLCKNKLLHSITKDGKKKVNNEKKFNLKKKSNKVLNVAETCNFKSKLNQIQTEPKDKLICSIPLPIIEKVPNIKKCLEEIIKSPEILEKILQQDKNILENKKQTVLEETIETTLTTDDPLLNSQVKIAPKADKSNCKKSLEIISDLSTDSDEIERLIMDFSEDETLPSKDLSIKKKINKAKIMNNNPLKKIVTPKILKKKLPRSLNETVSVLKAKAKSIFSELIDENSLSNILMPPIIKFSDIKLVETALPVVSTEIENPTNNLITENVEELNGNDKVRITFNEIFDNFKNNKPIEMTEIIQKEDIETIEMENNFIEGDKDKIIKTDVTLNLKVNKSLCNNNKLEADNILHVQENINEKHISKQETNAETLEGLNDQISRTKMPTDEILKVFSSPLAENLEIIQDERICSEIVSSKINSVLEEKVIIENEIETLKVMNIETNEEIHQNETPVDLTVETIESIQSACDSNSDANAEKQIQLITLTDTTNVFKENQSRTLESQIEIVKGKNDNTDVIIGKKQTENLKIAESNIIQLINYDDGAEYKIGDIFDTINECKRILSDPASESQIEIVEIDKVTKDEKIPEYQTEVEALDAENETNVEVTVTDISLINSDVVAKELLEKKNKFTTLELQVDDTEENPVKNVLIVNTDDEVISDNEIIETSKVDDTEENPLKNVLIVNTDDEVISDNEFIETSEVAPNIIVVEKFNNAFGTEIVLSNQIKSTKNSDDEIPIITVPILNSNLDVEITTENQKSKVVDAIPLMVENVSVKINEIVKKDMIEIINKTEELIDEKNLKTFQKETIVFNEFNIKYPLEQQNKINFETTTTVRTSADQNSLKVFHKNISTNLTDDLEKTHSTKIVSIIESLKNNKNDDMKLSQYEDISSAESEIQQQYQQYQIQEKQKEIEKQQQQQLEKEEVKIEEVKNEEEMKKDKLKCLKIYNKESDSADEIENNTIKKIKRKKTKQEKSIKTIKRKLSQSDDDDDCNEIKQLPLKRIKIERTDNWNSEINILRKYSKIFKIDFGSLFNLLNVVPKTPCRRTLLTLNKILYLIVFNCFNLIDRKNTVSPRAMKDFYQQLKQMEKSKWDENNIKIMNEKYKKLKKIDTKIKKNKLIIDLDYFMKLWENIRRLIFIRKSDVKKKNETSVNQITNTNSEDLIVQSTETSTDNLEKPSKDESTSYLNKLPIECNINLEKSSIETTTLLEEEISEKSKVLLEEKYNCELEKSLTEESIPDLEKLSIEKSALEKKLSDNSICLLNLEESSKEPSTSDLNKQPKESNFNLEKSSTNKSTLLEEETNKNSADLLQEKSSCEISEKSIVLLEEKSYCDLEKPLTDESIFDLEKPLTEKSTLEEKYSDKSICLLNLEEPSKEQSTSGLKKLPKECNLNLEKPPIDKTSLLEEEISEKSEEKSNCDLEKPFTEEPVFDLHKPSTDKSSLYKDEISDNSVSLLILEKSSIEQSTSDFNEPPKDFNFNFEKSPTDKSALLEKEIPEKATVLLEEKSPCDLEKPLTEKPMVLEKEIPPLDNESSFNLVKSSTEESIFDLEKPSTEELTLLVEEMSDKSTSLLDEESQFDFEKTSPYVEQLSGKSTPLLDERPTFEYDNTINKFSFDSENVPLISDPLIQPIEENPTSKSNPIEDDIPLMIAEEVNKTSDEFEIIELETEDLTETEKSTNCDEKIIPKSKHLLEEISEMSSSDMKPTIQKSTPELKKITEIFRSELQNHNENSTCDLEQITEISTTESVSEENTVELPKTTLELPLLHNVTEKSTSILKPLTEKSSTSVNEKNEMLNKKPENAPICSQKSLPFSVENILKKNKRIKLANDNLIKAINQSTVNQIDADQNIENNLKLDDEKCNKICMDIDKNSLISETVIIKVNDKLVNLEDDNLNENEKLDVDKGIRNELYEHNYVNFNNNTSVENQIKLPTINENNELNSMILNESSQNSSDNNSCHSHKSGIDFPDFLQITNLCTVPKEKFFPSINDINDHDNILEIEINTDNILNKNINDVVELLTKTSPLSSPTTRTTINNQDSNNTENVFDTNNLIEYTNWHDDFLFPDVVPNSWYNCLNLEEHFHEEYSSKKERDCLISGNIDGRELLPDEFLKPAGLVSPLLENNMVTLYSIDETGKTIITKSTNEAYVNMNCILKNQNYSSSDTVEKPNERQIFDIFDEQTLDAVIFNQEDSPAVHQTIEELGQISEAAETIISPKVIQTTSMNDLTQIDNNSETCTSNIDDSVDFAPHITLSDINICHEPITKSDPSKSQTPNRENSCSENSSIQTSNNNSTTFNTTTSSSSSSLNIDTLNSTDTNNYDCDTLIENASEINLVGKSTSINNCEIFEVFLPETISAVKTSTTSYTDIKQKVEVIQTSECCQSSKPCPYPVDEIVTQPTITSTIKDIPIVSPSSSTSQEYSDIIESKNKAEISNSPTISSPSELCLSKSNNLKTYSFQKIKLVSSKKSGSSTAETVIGPIQVKSNPIPVSKHTPSKLKKITTYSQSNISNETVTSYTNKLINDSSAVTKNLLSNQKIDVTPTPSRHTINPNTINSCSKTKKSLLDMPDLEMESTEHSYPITTSTPTTTYIRLKPSCSTKIIDNKSEMNNFLNIFAERKKKSKRSETTTQTILPSNQDTSKMNSNNYTTNKIIPLKRKQETEIFDKVSIKSPRVSTNNNTNITSDPFDLVKNMEVDSLTLPQKSHSITLKTDINNHLIDRTQTHKKITSTSVSPKKDNEITKPETQIQTTAQTKTINNCNTIEKNSINITNNLKIKPSSTPIIFNNNFNKEISMQKKLPESKSSSVNLYTINLESEILAKPLIRNHNLTSVHNNINKLSQRKNEIYNKNLCKTTNIESTHVNHSDLQIISKSQPSQQQKTSLSLKRNESTLQISSTIDDCPQQQTKPSTEHNLNVRGTTTNQQQQHNEISTSGIHSKTIRKDRDVINNVPVPIINIGTKKLQSQLPPKKIEVSSIIPSTSPSAKISTCIRSSSVQQPNQFQQINKNPTINIKSHFQPEQKHQEEQSRRNDVPKRIYPYVKMGRDPNINVKKLINQQQNICSTIPKPTPSWPTISPCLKGVGKYHQKYPKNLQQQKQQQTHFLFNVVQQETKNDGIEFGTPTVKNAWEPDIPSNAELVDFYKNQASNNKPMSNNHKYFKLG